MSGGQTRAASYELNMHVWMPVCVCVCECVCLLCCVPAQLKAVRFPKINRKFINCTCSNSKQPACIKIPRKSLGK